MSEGSSRAAPSFSRWTAAAVLAAVVVYAAALVLWREQIPQGIHNDTVEEAQRGMYLVDGGHFEVITFAIGNSAETLYLYVVGAAIRLFGPTTLAIQIVSWSCALGCVVLGFRLTRRVEPDVPPWIPLLLFTSSLWLFHYARAGLRAIAAPVFLLAVTLLLERADREPERRSAALVAGAVLGLSVYAYTSCRVLVLAWLIHAGTRFVRGSAAARRRDAYILLAVLIVSMPNFIFFARAPGAFLTRGSYVVRGGPIDWAGHLFWTFLLPLHYPTIYRLAVGPAHFTDGVSTSLKLAGLDPVHPLVAIAFFIGLVRLWRRRREPVPAFLLWVWLLGSVLLGFVGPSLTRLFILVPVYLVGAAAGFAVVLERFPRARAACVAALAIVLVMSAYAYFVTFAGSAEAQYVYSQAATPIGERAASLAANGQRVLCIVAKDVNTVRYLTARHADAVRVVEFYRRPLDPRQLPIDALQPQVILLERQPRFAAFGAVFPPERHVGTRAEYDEIRLSRVGPGSAQTGGDGTRAHEP